MMKDIQLAKVSKAVGCALGIELVKSVAIDDSMGDVTEISITFIATADQLRRIGLALSEPDVRSDRAG